MPLKNEHSGSVDRGKTHDQDSRVSTWRFIILSKCFHVCFIISSPDSLAHSELL